MIIPILLTLDMILYILFRLNGIKSASEIQLIIPFAWVLNLFIK